MSQFRTIGLVLPLGILLIAFQNCSPTKFASAEASASKVDMSSIAPVSLPDVGGDSNSEVTSIDTPPNSSTDQTGNVTTTDSRAKDDEYRTACARLQLQATSAVVADGLNIRSQSGRIRYRSGLFGHVDHNSGAIALACTKKDGGIQSLNGNSGITLICGCNVGEVNSHSGALIIVGGNVGSVQNTSGLVLIDGKRMDELGSHSGIIASH